MVPIWTIIFAVQVVYVACFTLRMILTLKGKTRLAAAISTVEVTIYVLGLNMVLQYLNQPISLLVYALGYGAGVLVGSWLEERLAMGYVTMKVITDDVHRSMASDLRRLGYGVTSWIGSGRDGDRLVLEVLAKRKKEHHLYRSILEIDPKAFVVTLEPKRLHGGFWTRSVRK